MTNAEKFLKEGVDILDFACEIEKANQLGEIDESICTTTCRWLNKEAKPTLTEDERVILKGISKDFSRIGRSCDDEIYLITMIDTIHEGRYVCDIFKDDLFQFIKEGEEYSIEGLLKGDKNNA